jgi:hypothetical protein
MMLETLIWLAFLIPPAAAGTSSIVRGGLAVTLEPGRAGEQREHFDPRHERLRAGTVEPSAAPAEDERHELRAAELQAPELLELRAGISAGSVVIAGLLLLLIVLII